MRCPYSKIAFWAIIICSCLLKFDPNLLSNSFDVTQSLCLSIRIKYSMPSLAYAHAHTRSRDLALLELDRHLVHYVVAEQTPKLKSK